MGYQHIIDQWAAGQSAPFALYEGHQGELVEAIPGKPALIQRGDTISEEIAERVRKHHTDLLHPEPLKAHVFLGLDDEGHAITKEVEIESDLRYPALTHYHPPLAYEHDQHCDMCGKISDELFKVVDGWYCKVPRTLPDTEGEFTCFNIRVAQLMPAKKENTDAQ